MEIKKSDKASLDNRRTTGFLLGLIFVLSVCYVGLEFTSNVDDGNSTADTFDDMSEDIEMLPAMDTHDMIAAAPVAAPSVTEKLKPVDTDPDISKKLNPNNNDVAQGVGAGMQTDLVQQDDQTTALSPVAVDEDDNPLNFRVVQQLPEFPGGMVEFMKWLTKNLKYPVMAQNRKIQGKVVVSFIINKDGSIANVKLEQGIDPSLDREALRVVRMMPKWKPGVEMGKPCRTMFAIPIVFRL